MNILITGNAGLIGSRLADWSSTISIEQTMKDLLNYWRCKLG
jgi:nucleoside-diphosphate-sugar epimerase